MNRIIEAPLAFSLIVILFVPLKANAQPVTQLIYSRPNSDNTPSEPVIIVNPLNPTTVIAASNSDFVYTSTNDGQTWSQMQDTGTWGNQGDPSLTINHLGTIYYCHLTGFFLYEGVVVQTSADNGASWDGGTIVDGLHGYVTDKPWLLCDRWSSAFMDNLYVVGVEIPSVGNGGYLIGFTRSTDRGRTWSQTVVLNPEDSINGGNIQVHMPTIEVGPNGELFVGWIDANGICMRTSTDGGSHFLPKQYICTSSNVTTFWNTQSIRDAFCNFSVVCDKSYSPFRGVLRLIWNEPHPPFSSKIFIQSSSDVGHTWSQPREVDTTAHDTYFPAATIDDATGELYISYYRQEADNTTNEYLAHQTSDTENFRVTRLSDASFLTGSYIGDYMGLASHNGHVYVPWISYDNLFQTLSLWVTMLKPVLNKRVTELSHSSIQLMRENDHFTLKLMLSGEGTTTITAVGILGNEVWNWNNHLASGNYEIPIPRTRDKEVFLRIISTSAGIPNQVPLVTYLKLLNLF